MRSKEERKVLKNLGLKDFRNISKDKVIELVSTIHELDPKVALKCLDQIPFVSETAQHVVTNYRELCNTLLSDNEIEMKEIDSHNLILQACQERIDFLGENITEEEYSDLITIMQTEAQEITKVGERKHELRLKILDGFKHFGTVAIGVVATGVGIYFKRK